MLTICFIVILTNINLSFALNRSNSQDISVVKLTDDTLLLDNLGNKTVIKTSSNKNEVRTDVYKLESGEHHYFIKNIIDNTLYSSITGKTD